MLFSYPAKAAQTCAQTFPWEALGDSLLALSLITFAVVFYKTTKSEKPHG